MITTRFLPPGDLSAKIGGADQALTQLQQKDVNATSVEEWNGLVRAYVSVDGGQIMQYFDRDTLAPVTP